MANYGYKNSNNIVNSSGISIIGDNNTVESGGNALQEELRHVLEALKESARKDAAYNEDVDIIKECLDLSFHASDQKNNQKGLVKLLQKLSEKAKVYIGTLLERLPSNVLAGLILEACK